MVHLNWPQLWKEKRERKRKRKDWKRLCNNGFSYLNFLYGYQMSCGIFYCPFLIFISLVLYTDYPFVQVISKLTDGKATHIPYRDSKLTRLLQSSLSGHGRVSVTTKHEFLILSCIVNFSFFFDDFWIFNWLSRCHCSLFALWRLPLAIVRRHTIHWSLHIAANM